MGHPLLSLCLNLDARKGVENHVQIMTIMIQIRDPSVVLHHTKAHLKPSREGAPFPTHQVSIQYYHYSLYYHLYPDICPGLPLLSVQAPLHDGDICSPG